MSEPHRLHPAAIILMGLQIVRQFAALGGRGKGGDHDVAGIHLEVLA